ncbi:MAG: hemerythrin domain-containing protein [bacterium]
MKRHEALHDLSRDHFEALLQAQQIKQAVEGGEEGETAEDAARTFLGFWEGGGRMHFVEEEEILLSVYSRHAPPTENEDIRTMLDDHAWIRDRVRDLKEQFEAGEDVRGLLAQVGQRLHDHARLEERVIFEHMQELFTEDELIEVAERSRAFREEMRGPHAIGPDRPGLEIPSEEDI